jgi:hypothetical protein
VDERGAAGEDCVRAATGPSHETSLTFLSRGCAATQKNLKNVQK